MKFNATIELNKIQVSEIITQALKNQDIHINPQDIEFEVKKIEKGNQRDSWVVYEFTCVKIKNVQIGELQ